MSEGVDAMREGVATLDAVHCVLRMGFCSVHTFSLDRCLGVLATHCAVLCRAVLCWSCCAGRAVLVVLCWSCCAGRAVLAVLWWSCCGGRGRAGRAVLAVCQVEHHPSDTSPVCLDTSPVCPRCAGCHTARSSTIPRTPHLSVPVCHVGGVAAHVGRGGYLSSDTHPAMLDRDCVARCGQVKHYGV
jgi:hypothetical protein